MLGFVVMVLVVERQYARRGQRQLSEVAAGTAERVPGGSLERNCAGNEGGLNAVAGRVCDRAPITDSIAHSMVQTRARPATRIHPAPALRAE